MVVNIKIVGTEDWEALYVNNKLIYQYHHIQRIMILDAIRDKQVEDAEEYYFDSTSFNIWFEEAGEFPANLLDIPKEFFID